LLEQATIRSLNKAEQSWQ